MYALIPYLGYLSFHAFDKNTEKNSFDIGERNFIIQAF